MHPSALIRSGAQAPRSVACAPPRMTARNAAPRRLSGAKPSAAAHSTTPSSAPVASVISDAAVPEGHRGLHASLYGEGGAEAHDSSTDYRVRKGEDDGDKLIKVAKWLEARDSEKPLGVYALYDKAKQPQYVGYSRNMVLAVKAHLQRVGPEACAYVRAMVFANKAVATRGNMEREVQNWIQEMGKAPPGNDQDRALWEGGDASVSSSVVVAVMSESERTEYEEKRLKMMRAMGESIAQGEEGESSDAADRRSKIMAAVQNDDWSVVIDGQTREATSNGGAVSSGAASSTSGDAVVSPFSQASVHRSLDSVDFGEAPPVMNVETVNHALEQVRPYLIADGGNVEVADVAAGVVFLRLEGACNTCSSSATTMRMGIERALQITFGSQLKEVVQVGAGEATVVTVSTVESHLDKLRGAITNIGGRVQVVDVQQGTCVIKYAGPEAIGKGIAAAIKDTFQRDIQEVIVLGF